MELLKCVANTTGLLSSLRQWLEDNDDDEKWWQLQTQVAQLCLSELQLLVGMGSQVSGEEASHVAALRDVIPDVKNMVDGMHQRNRAAALACGKRALKVLTTL